MDDFKNFVEDFSNFIALGWNWNGEFHYMANVCPRCARLKVDCTCPWSKLRGKWVNTPAQRYRWGLRLWQVRRYDVGLNTRTQVHRNCVFPSGLGFGPYTCPVCGKRWSGCDRWGGRTLVGRRGMS